MSRERVERGAVPPRAETHTTTTSSRLTRADAGLQDRRGVFSYKLGFEFHEFSDRAEAVAFLEASKGTSTCCPWARSGRPESSLRNP
jgi:hypothetical protein